jgi:hypothetical protein
MRVIIGLTEYLCKTLSALELASSASLAESINSLLILEIHLNLNQLQMQKGLLSRKIGIGCFQLVNESKFSCLLYHRQT